MPRLRRSETSTSRLCRMSSRSSRALCSVAPPTDRQVDCWGSLEVDAKALRYLCAFAPNISSSSAVVPEPVLPQASHLTMRTHCSFIRRSTTATGRG
jgi:hypothetical protein